ncbi:MAG: hypothetical protein DCF19_15420 [Pseudanabaena frigida]|uniref:Uncharacterized protein n=1 Tax=Pseudanabaena frigida TaxID=945775 RepID=A0A2W4XTZ8_9CYAN|nr:MAG: hypothetical protein DCF19_15420 [Pseudanabaena frigida]
MNNQTQTLSTFDDNFWRQNYHSCLYVEQGMQYEAYQPAYQTGHEGYDRYPGKSFDEAEAELKRDYEAALAQQNATGLNWDRVKDAVRDAWDQAGTT